MSHFNCVERLKEIL